MRILVSNDDGIYAPGIRALHGAVKDLGEVHVVAPISERSAVGHAITLSDPLKTTRVQMDGAFFGYGIGGTPADCVKLAISALMSQPPDLVISGINHGPNPGINIIYSGTVSAATEGTILGYPSMAISIDTFETAHWDTAARVAREMIGRWRRHGLPRDTLLNVNVPNRPYDQLRGYAVTRMGRSRFVESFDKRSDPRGNDYYWMAGEMELLDEGPDTDIQALRAGYVSVTPIGLDFTQYSALDEIRGWGFEQSPPA
jgi:5'-nucleotidase